MSEQYEKAEVGGVGEINNVPRRTAVAGPNAQFRKYGNPGPLGLYAFASTTLLLSLFNVTARDIHTPNLIVGMALFVGGLVQLLAGMWEFACANTFGATAFSMYGAFWMSFGTIYVPGSGILTSYTSKEELGSAVGLYLFMWFIVTFLLFIASLRRNLGMIALFFFLTLTFLMLGVSNIVPSSAADTAKAGGALGIVTAFIAFYVGTAQLLIREESWFTIPVGTIPQRLD
ncbi:FUN34 transmembrane protein [Amylocystis lapponica]|nr:FUN34 transmembrane protein [Amylocystis lapponica]